jgi:hypothetical protein
MALVIVVVIVAVVAMPGGLRTDITFRRIAQLDHLERVRSPW